jgi:hypothetical protein
MLSRVPTSAAPLDQIIEQYQPFIELGIDTAIRVHAPTLAQPLTSTGDDRELG